MEGGIEFEVVWSDQDVSQLQCKCSNGRFSGSASININHDDLRKMAEVLRGFPSHAADIRNIELGTFNPNHADGGIRMHFYCRDSAGHAAVDIQMRGDACTALGEPESVALHIPVDAAAIDSFILQAVRIDTNKISATARLDMAR